MLPSGNFPASSASGPNWGAPGRSLPPAVPARTQAPASTSQSTQPASPRPIIRLQAEDEPRPPARSAIPEAQPTRLALPAPEELGIDSAPASIATDWAAVHRRLNELGATCFHLDKVADGGYRITCLLPTGQPSRTHRVEAQAASEATALALALERVETWVKRR